MARFLIVNADDLGLHEDINRGIQLAHTAGIVTSASLVACGDAFEHATAVMRECPQLDIGVHLTLIEEQPLCTPDRVPSLVAASGRFLPSYQQLTARALAGAISADEVRRELRAQIERVIATGAKPSHLDGHQHIHVLPRIWHVVVDLAREYDIRWIRVPQFTSLFRSRRSGLDPFFRLALNIVSGARRRASNGLTPAIRTAGLHLSGQLREGHFERLIAGLRPGISELVTHPGLTTHSLTQRYRWQYEWNDELTALTSPQTKALLRAKGVKLLRFSEC